MDWNAAALSALFGSIMSLLFAYLPYLREWYDATDPRWKPIIQAALLLVVSFGRLAVVCDFDWPCIYAGAGDAAGVWLAALIGNQTAFLVGVKQFKQAQGATYTVGYSDEDVDAIFDVYPKG